MMAEETLKLFPVEVSFTRAPTEPLAPQVLDLMVEEAKRAHIAGHAVVVVVTPQLLV